MTDVVGSVRSLSGEALLEECAVTRAELPPNCGVFLGIELRDQLRLGEGSAARRLAGELRVAGPAEVIDAGATSEAAALARARRALLDRECDAAIAGGAESLTLLAPEGRRASLDPVPGDDDRSAAQLLVLSAKDARSLAAQASRLAAWLDAHRQVSLRDVAWTLQCGREAMEHRIAFVVTSVDDARSKLLAAAPAGNVASIGDLFGNEPDDLNYLRTLWAAGKLERVARFWTAGAPVPWKALGHCGRRITGLGAQASPVPMLSDIQRSYLVGREAPLFGGTSCYLCWELEHRGWDLPRLEAAWNKLVARHEMLRTVFTAGAVPRVLDDVPHYALEVFDWRDDANAAARLAELREQSMQAENVPSQWPLFRISVAILPQAMHLFFGIDLAVADGRSVLLLLRELGELYDDPLKEAPPPPVGFRDHLASLHARKATASHREHVEYWTKRLDEIPPAPDLPTTGAVIERSHFRRIDHRISREAWQAIQGHAAKRGLSKVSVFLAAFSEVLGRWASRSDFTLNLTAARREAVHPAMDDVVGDFTTNVLLAVDCRERVSFAARVRAVKEQLARDLEHVDFGGVEVIAALSKRKRESVLMPVVFTSLLHHDVPFPPLGRFRTGITRTPQVTLD
ncbi:MAG TPA: condensation domain-containing protein, partial [Thermoanaerobaculia bacterium]